MRGSSAPHRSSDLGARTPGQTTLPAVTLSTVGTLVLKSHATIDRAPELVHSGCFTHAPTRTTRPSDTPLPLPGNQAVLKFAGNTEQSVRIRVTLAQPAGAATRKEVGPIALNFEVPMYNVSNLQVKYLRIADQGKAYNPYRWVRYVTNSSSYVCRV